MPSEQTVKNSDNSDSHSEVQLLRKRADDKWHHPHAEDICLFRVRKKNLGMVGQY
jgi:hypothetical protein